MIYSKFDVVIESKCYPVIVGDQILGNIGKFVEGIFDKAFVVTDDVVSKIHLDPLLKSLKESNIETITRILPSGERFKTIETGVKIYTFL
ncbi:MAG: hypothetical protein KAQ65_05870, partial [Candidatus Thorarchaeota archaeon]|nr:hypothetical protein [Candidatus Thorarchaeota archaeon]